MKRALQLAALSALLVSTAASAQSSGGGGGSAPSTNPVRLGLVLGVDTAPGAGDNQLPESTTNFGLELSAPMGANWRYHAAFAWSHCCDSGANGFQVAPLGFGWGLPVYKRGHLRVEAEGGASLVEMQLLDASGDLFINFSTALFAQATASYDRFYVTLEPVGLGFSWLTIYSENGGGGRDTGGFSPEYRFRISAGLNF